MNAELETLAVFVHGGLAAGHLLGLVFNIRRRQWFDSSAHFVALVYDSYAAYKHAQELKEKL